jgi:hypothetical protein
MFMSSDSIVSYSNAQIGSKIFCGVYGVGTLMRWYDFDHVEVNFVGEDYPVICNINNVIKLAEA